MLLVWTSGFSGSTKPALILWSIFQAVGEKPLGIARKKKEGNAPFLDGEPAVVHGGSGSDAEVFLSSGTPVGLGVAVGEHMSLVGSALGTVSDTVGPCAGRCVQEVLPICRCGGSFCVGIGCCECALPQTCK